MSFEGDLASRPLSKVMQSLAQERQTGILTVQGKNDIVAVSFLSGEVVAADALNQTQEEGLGTVLERQGLISRADFEVAAEEYQGGSSGSLGELLIERGYLDREQLLEGLRLQTFQLMKELLDWQQGEFKFYVGDEVSYEDGFRAIPVEELLIRAREPVAAPPTPAQEPLPGLEEAYRRLRTDEKVRVLGRDGDGSGAGIWLTREEAAVLRAVDGEKTASEIAESIRLGRYKVQYCLMRLRQQELVEARPPAATGSLTLEAEIFLPPDEATAEGTGTYTATVPASEPWRPWVGHSLGAVLAILLILALSQRPVGILLPIPWQEEQRQALEKAQRISLFQKINHGAKTHYLVHGRYPLDLDELVGLRIIATDDRYDPTGRALAYMPEETAYNIRDASSADDSPGSAAYSEAVTGDFYLDADFVSPSASLNPPLVLLD